MTCAELDILLCDYVDGTLDPQRKAAVEEHLANCATCAEAARDASMAVQFLAQATPVEPPPELVTRLLFEAPSAKQQRERGGILGIFTRFLEPVLQPRFAMGMAMTILSFSLLAKFAGIPERHLTPADLHPAQVWNAVGDRFYQTYDGAVKYYRSLRVVYEIQNRLSEWSTEEQTPQDETGGVDEIVPVPGQTQSLPGGGEDFHEEGERSVAE
jgi:hypothetical protein